MQHLCQAFDADPGQPAVLIMLARLCINRGDPERARSLAIAAHAVAAAPEARAHALVLQGRAEHALSKWQEARQCYQDVRPLRKMCNCFRAPPGASGAGPVHINVAYPAYRRLAAVQEQPEFTCADRCFSFMHRKVTSVALRMPPAKSVVTFRQGKLRLSLRQGGLRLISSRMQALKIDGALPLPLFGMAQLNATQVGGVDRALANLEKALDKVLQDSLPMHWWTMFFTTLSLSRYLQILSLGHCVSLPG